MTIAYIAYAVGLLLAFAYGDSIKRWIKREDWK